MKELTEKEIQLLRYFKESEYDFVFANWNLICCNYKLSEGFIIEFQDKVNWNFISTYQKLSEDFIRKFQDKVYWIYISKHQKLSENFIIEFKDKIDWNCISNYQKLSNLFIRKNIFKLNKLGLLYNPNISEKIKQTITILS